MTAVGIHGFGRIGRCLFRAAHQQGLRVGVVTDRATDIDNQVYLLRHDSVYGAPPFGIEADRDGWWADDAWVRYAARTSIVSTPWADQGVDTVIDATGTATRADCEALLAAGVRRVVLTRDCAFADATVIAGTRSIDDVGRSARVLATSTCDANALAVVIGALADRGLVRGVVTTLHPALSYQSVLDSVTEHGYPPEQGRNYGLARAAGVNIIPKNTSVLTALGAVMPDEAMRLVAMSYRVPVTAVSTIDLQLSFERGADIDAVRADLRRTATGSKGILGYSDDPLVSSDLVGSPAAVTIGGCWIQADRATGRELRLVGWYDNEAGYAMQVIRVIEGTVAEPSPRSECGVGLGHEVVVET